MTMIKWYGFTGLASNRTHMVVDMSARRPLRCARACDAGEATGTHTVLLLTFAPVTRTGGVLSIPRDLWTAIPNGRGGYFYDRINTAYRWGGMSGYRGGSMAATRDTVQHLLPQI